MALLTIAAYETAVGAELHGLVWRLLRDFHAAGDSLRPEVVRSTGELARLALDLTTIADDCRGLLRRKLEGRQGRQPKG